MKRKIKFRGQHIHILPQNKFIDRRWIYGYMPNENYINSPELLEGEFLVDKDTVGQYIGIKDKNGKEIYEEDIVRNKQEELYKVEYWSSMCRFVLVTKLGTWKGIEIDYDISHSVCSELEVIGNMYEDTDLFKKSED